jgi:capping protein beta
MVEEIEMKIRSMLQEVYFQKTKDVVNIIRSTKSKKDEEFKLDFKNSLANSLKQRAMKNNQE